MMVMVLLVVVMVGGVVMVMVLDSYTHDSCGYLHKVKPANKCFPDPTPQWEPTGC